jgi:hypothetical protein
LAQRKACEDQYPCKTEDELYRDAGLAMLRVLRSIRLTAEGMAATVAAPKELATDFRLREAVVASLAKGFPGFALCEVERGVWQVSRPEGMTFTAIELYLSDRGLLPATYEGEEDQ